MSYHVAPIATHASRPASPTRPKKQTAEQVCTCPAARLPVRAGDQNRPVSPRKKVRPMPETG
jgi:hypothetical protein